MSIRLEERMGTIAHVFTYLGPLKRFEKAGPLETDRFTYADVAATSASRFVHCQSMQKWIDDSISSELSEFTPLDKKLTEMEALIDVRNGPKGPAQNNLNKLA